MAKLKTKQEGNLIGQPTRVLEIDNENDIVYIELPDGSKKWVNKSELGSYDLESKTEVVEPKKTSKPKKK